MDSAETRFDNSVSTALTQKQQSSLDALSLTKEVSLDIQEKTVTQSANSLWHMLHRKIITASKFGLVARRVQDFENLIKQLNPSRHVVTAPIRRGIELEPKAAMAYANKAKDGSVNLFPSGLKSILNAPGLAAAQTAKCMIFKQFRMATILLVY